MAEQYDNELKGVLFKNDRMRPGHDDPPYQGNCTINGQDFYISAWVNKSKKDGKSFFGLRFKPKQPAAPDPRPNSPPPATEEDPDIPF